MCWCARRTSTGSSALYSARHRLCVRQSTTHPAQRNDRWTDRSPSCAPIR
jgi:hypothetical protein